MKADVAVLLVLVTVDVVTPQCISKNDKKPPPSVIDLSNATRFGLDLLQEFYPVGLTENLFFSPYSIWNALVLAYFGAAGNTEKELEAALYLNGKTDTLATYRALSQRYSGRQNSKISYVVDQANRIYVAEGLTLRKCVKTVLPDELQSLNFLQAQDAATTINQFVEQTTRGKISRIVSERNVLGVSTMLLVNAVYFKGSWIYKFNASDTNWQDFHSTPTTSEKVEMMTYISGLNYGRSQELGAEVVELPYEAEGDKSASMFVLLPSGECANQSNRAPIDCLVHRLTPDRLQAAISNLKLTNVNVTIPKFTMKQTIRPRKFHGVLNKLKIVDLFSSASDLTNYDPTGVMNPGRGLIHKAVVEVNEEGTEAAGVTSSILRLIIPFICNRPFLFIILEKPTNNILFVGIFRDP